MSPTWSPPYKLRRSSHVLSYSVKNNFDLLQVGGEPCYLLQRQRRADASFQLASRRVDTITETISGYSIDPDTGMLRYRLWQDGVDPNNRYPDIGVFTCTVQASASTDVWEPAVDKYTFIPGRDEYAFDIFQNEYDSVGNKIDDAMYIVFNTPPFHVSDLAMITYGTISPAVSFESMQPTIENQEGFMTSLFGYEQWLKLDARIRRRKAPHRFPLAFSNVLHDFVLDSAGLIRMTKHDFWTSPPPYCPTIVEHDVVIRPATTERFQVVNYMPIYLEDILCGQHFDLAALDPRSRAYDIEINEG